MSLFDKLKEFGKKDKVSFHVPGHRFGHGLDPEFRRRGFETDVTEFDETDDLQMPNGILAEALERAAAAFGAEHSFYLTNGSSVGINAAIVGSCSRGDKIIIDRTCHKSVYSAVILQELRPVFISPEFDKKNGLYIGINPNEVERVLGENSDATGMIITSPSYYGVCSDVKRISEILHAQKKFLIVDEAHGAHFAFHPELPMTALCLGADAVIQSVHKTLPAMGQSALLHLAENSLIRRKSVSRALRLFQTTSPSYMMMTSIDCAVEHMLKHGRDELNERIKEAESLKVRVAELGVIRFFDGGCCDNQQDVLRLVADVRRTGKTGAEISGVLKRKYGIYAEMTDYYHIVFVITCANTAKDIRTLERALCHISKETLKNSDLKSRYEKGFLPYEIKELPDIKVAVLPFEAWGKNNIDLPLSDAEGRICADITSVCPPGSAMLIPGQLITRDDIEYMHSAGMTLAVSVLTE